MLPTALGIDNWLKANNSRASIEEVTIEDILRLLSVSNPRGELIYPSYNENESGYIAVLTTIASYITRVEAKSR